MVSRFWAAMGGDELGLLGMKRLLAVLRWRKGQIGGCWCGGWKREVGCYGRKVVCQEGDDWEREGKRAGGRRRMAVLCSLVLFWQMGSVLMTGQGDGGQVLRGKRNGDDYWFGRETEEMGNHGFVGEACPGFWMLKWPRVKWFFFWGGEALAWRGRGLCAGMLENGVGRRLV